MSLAFAIFIITPHINERISQIRSRWDARLLVIPLENSLQANFPRPHRLLVRVIGPRPIPFCPKHSDTKFFAYASESRISYQMQNQSKPEILEGGVLFFCRVPHIVQLSGPGFVFGLDADIVSLPEHCASLALSEIRSYLRSSDSANDLKLIAPQLDDRIEMKWSGGKWRTSGGRHDVLESSNGQLEFSIVNEKKEQNMHAHTRSIEMYASTHPYHFEWSNGVTRIRDEAKPNSVVGFPACIVHKVTLSGLAFVLRVGDGSDTSPSDSVDLLLSD